MKCYICGKYISENVSQRKVNGFIACSDCFFRDQKLKKKLEENEQKRKRDNYFNSYRYRRNTGSIKTTPRYYTPQRRYSSGGCYIATCVYGSYNCPEVWTLRRFRDFTLASKWYGRIFIKAYYSISPKLVYWFGNKRSFKCFWKFFLDKIVKNLNKKGVENTKYKDIDW